MRIDLREGPIKGHEERRGTQQEIVQKKVQIRCEKIISVTEL